MNIQNNNNNDEWYLSTWFIALLCACWFLILPPIGGIVLLIIKSMREKKQQEVFSQTFAQNNLLVHENTKMKEACDKLGVTEYAETKKKLDSLNDEIQNDNVLIDKLRSQITELQ